MIKNRIITSFNSLCYADQKFLLSTQLFMSAFKSKVVLLLFLQQNRSCDGKSDLKAHQLVGIFVLSGLGT